MQLCLFETGIPFSRFKRVLLILTQVLAAAGAVAQQLPVEFPAIAMGAPRPSVVAISDDANFVAMLHSPFVSVFQVGEGWPRVALIRPGEELTNIAIARNSPRIAIVSEPDDPDIFQRVTVWDFLQNRLLQTFDVTLESDLATPEEVFFDASGTRLVIADFPSSPLRDKTSVLDISTGQVLATYTTAAKALFGNLLWMGCEDSDTFIYVDINTGNEMTRPGQCNDYRLLAFSQGGEKFLYEDGELLDTTTNHTIELPYSVSAAAFSPDAGRVAVYSGGYLAVLNTSTGAEIVDALVTERGQFSSDAPLIALRFRQDGGGIVTVAESGRMNGVSSSVPVYSGIGLYHTPVEAPGSNAQYEILKTAVNEAAGLVALAVNLTDFTVRIYDLNTGRLVVTFPYWEEFIFSMDFSSDGSQLAIASNDFDDSSARITVLENLRNPSQLFGTSSWRRQMRGGSAVNSWRKVAT